MTNPTVFPAGTTYCSLSSDGLTLTSTGVGPKGGKASNAGTSDQHWYVEFIIGYSSDGGAFSVGLTLFTSGLTLSSSLQHSSNATTYSYASDGKYWKQNVGTSYGSTYGPGDVVGIEWDGSSSGNGKIIFWLNGVSQGVAVSGLGTSSAPNAGYFPCACFEDSTGYGSGSTIVSNFGKNEFLYPVSGVSSLDSILGVDKYPQTAKMWGARVISGGQFTSRLEGQRGIQEECRLQLWGSRRIFFPFTAGLAGQRKFIEPIPFTAQLHGERKLGFVPYLAKLEGQRGFFNEYHCQLMGARRIQQDGLAGYRLYHGVDVLPDFTDSPEQIESALPFDTAALSTGHTHYLCVRYRNAYGLESQNTDCQMFEISADGIQQIRPTAPGNITIAQAGLSARIIATYFSTNDDPAPATSWLIYYRTDGTSPDTSTDTPVTVALTSVGGLAVLDWTSPAQTVGTVMKFILKTKRGTAKSDDSAEMTLTIQPASTVAVLASGVSGRVGDVG